MAMPIQRPRTSPRVNTGPGFYKATNNKQGLTYAAVAVHNSEYSLVAGMKDSYQYPVDGWTWYEDRSSAILGEEIIEEPQN